MTFSVHDKIVIHFLKFKTPVGLVIRRGRIRCFGHVDVI